MLDMQVLVVQTGGKEVEEVILPRVQDLELVNEAGMTPLLQATRDGSVATVRALLDLGANMEAVNKYGQTALLLAAKAGHTEILIALLDGGAESRQAAWDKRRCIPRRCMDTRRLWSHSWPGEQRLRPPIGPARHHFTRRLSMGN